MYVSTANVGGSFFLPRDSNCFLLFRTLDPLNRSPDDKVTINDLKTSNGPVLAVKRGSTLLRNPSSSGTILRADPLSNNDSSMWETPAPLPPHRRDNTTRISGLTGSTAEAVPLRSGDLLLENGNDTILVRGNNARPINITS